jgi:hypothetical protein
MDVRGEAEAAAVAVGDSDVPGRAEAAAAAADTEAPAAPRRAVSRRQYLGTLAAGAVVVAASTAVGLWFTPFALGVFLGVAGMVRGLRPRTALWCGAAAAALGWAVPLVVRAAAGEGVVATARIAGAMTGLPASGGLFIAVTLLIAALQAMMGAWLGRALAGPVVRRRRRGRKAAALGDTPSGGTRAAGEASSATLGSEKHR